MLIPCTRHTQVVRYIFHVESLVVLLLWIKGQSGVPYATSTLKKTLYWSQARSFSQLQMNRSWIGLHLKCVDEVGLTGTAVKKFIGWPWLYHTSCVCVISQWISMIRMGLSPLGIDCCHDR